MSSERQSKTNGWLLRLVLLLLAIIGFFCRQAWSDIKARQETTEMRVIAVEVKIDTLTQKVDDRLAVAERKVVLK